MIIFYFKKFIPIEIWKVKRKQLFCDVARLIGKVNKFKSYHIY